jgi:hypothetical protein
VPDTRYSPICHGWSTDRLFIVTIFASLFLAGCFGDSGPNELTVDGTTQKGFFEILEVQAFTVDETNGTLGEATEVTVTEQSFSVAIAAQNLTLFEASGTFTSEITGTPVVADEPLKLLLAPDTADLNANINIATTLIAERVLRDLENGGVVDVGALIQQHTDFINIVLGFPAGTDPANLDFNDITDGSDMTDPNLQLLILGGGIVELLSNDQLFAGGFGNIVNGIVAAQSIEEAIAVMSVLNGLSANAIYALALQYSGFDLPLNVLGNNFFIWVCDVDNNCQWLEVTEPLVSVSGSSGWEASGTLSLYVRLNEVSTADVVVNLVTASDTATMGEDFIGVSRRVTVPAGQLTVNVEIDLIIDALPEANEDILISIQSLTEAYPVFQGEARARIWDREWAGLVDQDAAGLLLMSLKVAALCNPVTNMSDANCVPLNGAEMSLPIVAGRTSIAATEIDLAADCADSALATCPVLETNVWLVDFFLVAKDNAGTAVGEVALGPYLYLKDTVQLEIEDPLPRTPLIRLTDDATLALGSDAMMNSWDLTLEARIGTTNQIVDDDPIPPFMAVPDSVQVGDTLLDIGSVFDVMPGADFACTFGQYAINAQYSQPGIPTIIGSGTICVDFDIGGAGAGPANMVSDRLDIVGGSADPANSTIVYLPPGLYSTYTLVIQRPPEDGGPLTIKQTVPFIPIGPAAIGTVTVELHSEGWPFVFIPDAFSLTPAGMEIGYSDMRYVMDVAYSNQDPRSLGLLYSNDIYYRGVEAQSGALTLGPVGVTGNIAIAGGPGHADHTAFPRARVQWQGFNQGIVDNVLEATTITIDDFRMGQATSCNGPDCVLGQKDFFSVDGAGIALDGKGYVLGNVSNTGPHDEPRWGARSNGQHAWSRPDDLVAQQQMKLALPGYIIPSDTAASEVLLGHLNEPVAPGDVDIYPRGSDAAVDGNYHPTGLSIGPETYRDPTGVPVRGIDGQDLSLLGARQRLDNGIDPAFDLLSSPAVKYVIRNAGITGVFNVASGSLVGASPQFYGYPIDLSRFAVRTVDNVLDTYNWIDGRLALNGDAGGAQGLDIFFTNLEIDCSARLGNIDLQYEACDALDNNGNGEIDENCSPVLYSWQTETDIFAASFKGGAPGQACAVGVQTFGLQHQMRFAALNKPVAFDTEWDAAGNLTSQTSGELPNYRFDRSAEGRGFPFKTKGAVLGSAQVNGDGYGWLDLKGGQIGVPFWNSLDADLRVANGRRFGEIAAEPTVVLKPGELAARNANQRNKDVLKDGNAASESNNALAIDAKYEWGRTGFGFTLPVYYQPWQMDTGRSDEDAEGRQSRFLGRPLSKDLFVLDANAGINFIEPDRTKLSFGASADFTRLEGLEFQIDVTDADSAAAIDDMLQDLGIINGPLFEPALTDMLDTMNIVNRYANRGMNELLQEGLETTLEKIGEATAPLTPNGQDPFVTATETLTQIRSMPQQTLAFVAEEIQAPLNNTLFAMETRLRTELLDAETQIAALPSGANQVQIDTAFAIVDKLLATLDQMADDAHAIDAQVENAITQATDLQVEAILKLLEVVQATNDIDLVVEQTVTFVDAACRNGFVVAEEGNGYLNDVALRFAAIRRVADIIRNTTEWLDAAEVIAKTAEAKRRLGTAKQRIQDATSELLEFITAADDAVSDLVCDSTQIDLVQVKTRQYTAKVRAHAQTFAENVVANRSAIDELNALRTTLTTRVLQPIDALRNGLHTVREEAPDYGGGSLNGLVSCILYDATHPGECVDTSTVPAAIEPFGVNALAANDLDSDERDIADLIFDGTRTELDQHFAVISDGLLTITNGLMPGAYMTPEQLRRMLVTEIMRTAPIKDLRREMDKHFSEISYAMNGIVLQVVDQVNAIVEEAVSSVTGPINDALSEATSVVRGIPLQSAGINGFATIAGNELERAHISAGWTMRGGDDDDSTGFRAALDAESWSAKHTNPDQNTPTSCNVGANESLLDVKISAYGLPINVMAADINIEKLYLGFTLRSGQPNGPALIPIGIFGGINTIGEIGFTDAIVFDPAFAAGLGEKQTYIGASAGAVFSSLAADVAFLVGRVCPGNTVLTDLDPEVEKFLPNLPASGFTGAYLRGGATIPIIPGGCALNVGVVADFGSWIFVGSPTTIGGLIGGGATGQIACIAALKGKATVGGSATTDGDLKLTGEAWGVAGIGADCDPGTWTSVSRSRKDKWCGTGDAKFEVSFDNGEWSFKPPKPSAIH